VHKTEVEPDTFAWGNTIVSAFHVARRPGSIGWGSGDVGFATSTNGGVSWTHGDLAGLTVNYKGGTYGAAADPSVAYDAKHGDWLISTLPLVGLSSGSQYIGDVAVSRSTDGLTWEIRSTSIRHILTTRTGVCATTDDESLLWKLLHGVGSGVWQRRCSAEPIERRRTDLGSRIGFVDHAGGLGGEPQVQPNGTVIVPFEGGGIDVFSSTNGGASWGKSQQIASIDSHFVAAGYGTRICRRPRSMERQCVCGVVGFADSARGAKKTIS